MLTSHEIRQQYISYFQDKHDHRFVPSSPVVPHEDATLLFANAGMNQFKDLFLGTGSRDYTRAVNTQKCIRAGGKHNDLEDVGKDTIHQTFFEMLGNWSFGDYFKAEAITWAWDLLTNVWGLPKDRLHATVFAGDDTDGLPPDTEAEALWARVTDINPAHITRWGKKDNFWEMGDSGPCGPCSEIHIDLTPDGNGGDLVNRNDARVLELWNLVFIQFNRDASGRLSQLPAKHVDTGLGFERITAVLQGKGSNYDTDVFAPLFTAIGGITGARPYGSALDDPIDTAYRVIADHIRCLTIALTDGAMPGNEGRGYVLRRILRRAVRHGWQTLDVHEPFLYRLVDSVVEAMGEAFPELTRNPQQVAAVIREEEESFGVTLDRGIALFNQAAGRKEAAATARIPAEDAFKLHDTYGFPLDLTQVMAEERGMAVDVTGFDELMAQARQIARAAGGRQDVDQALVDIVQKEGLPKTQFVGYDSTRCADGKIVAAFKVEATGYEKIAAPSQGDELALVVESTPFYAEAGGQVGDTGTIGGDGGWFRVDDTVQLGGVYFHLGKVTSKQLDLQAPTAVTLEVEPERRADTMANHTATHMLNRALRVHVNPDADQKGSLVDHEKLRFDFAHNAPLTDEQIEQVERTVNTDIGSDLPVYHDVAPLDEAQRIKSLRAVFGEKYGHEVRVVSIGAPVRDVLAAPDSAEWADRSIELCGGTHLSTTGDAEGLVVIQEEAVAKGIRRITACTGRSAHQAAARGDLLATRLEALKNCQDDVLANGLAELTEAIQSRPLPAVIRSLLQQGVAELQKRLREHQKQQDRAATSNVVDVARDIADAADGNLIVAAVANADAKTLRDAMDVIRKKRPAAALLLGAATGDRCAFIAAVPPALIERGLKAGDWVRHVAQAAGGGGGGRPDMAQAGGKDAAKLNEALEAGRSFATQRI